MTVSVAQLSPIQRMLGSNQAEDVVLDRYSFAEQYAENAFAEVQDYLDYLKNIFAEGEPTVPDSGFERITAPSFPDIIGEPPEAPTDEEMTPSVITPPTEPDIKDINLPALDMTLPDAPDGELTGADFVYNEGAYSSLLDAAVKEGLLDWIENGGTGLDADVENDLWERTLARTEADNERAYKEAENYYSSRGYDLPPGALTGRLLEINREIVRNRTQINAEISIEQARLAQNNTQFSYTKSIELEGQEKAHFNNIYNRALQAAIATTEGIIKVYQAKIQGFLGQVQAKEAEANAYGTYAQAQASINDANVKVYSAKVEAYKAQLLSELSIIENIGKVYMYQVQGYEAKARVSASQVDAEIKRFAEQVRQEGVLADITLKEAELALQTYLSKMKVTLEQIQGGANIAAQIAASALAGVSVTASIGDSSSRSDQVSYSYSQGISNASSLSEIHTYEETGG